jgi:hypothetical protein
MKSSKLLEWMTVLDEGVQQPRLNSQADFTAAVTFSRDEMGLARLVSVL